MVERQALTEEELKGSAGGAEVLEDGELRFRPEEVLKDRISLYAVYGNCPENTQTCKDYIAELASLVVERAARKVGLGRRRQGVIHMNEVYINMPNGPAGLATGAY